MDKQQAIWARGMNGRRTMTFGIIMVLAAAAGVGGTTGAAHAQEGGTIPAWIKSIFEFYVDGQITDAELISALEYLIAQGIIHVSAAVEPDSDPAGTAAERAEAGVAGERAAAATDRAAELAGAAVDSIADAAQAEAARDRATSPSAIRENSARADAAVREAAEAAEAAAEAIAEAADAAREASMDAAVADSRARIAATAHAAADSLTRTGELAVEAEARRIHQCIQNKLAVGGPQDRQRHQ